MKKYIIQVVFIAIVFCTIYWLFTVIEDLRNENKRLKTNQTALATGNLSNEKTYTKREFEQYMVYADSLAQSKGIKTKQIVKYIRLGLTFSDSVKIANTIKPDLDLGLDLIDDELDVRFIDVQENCYTTNVVSYPDTSIVQTQFNSDIDAFLYWEHLYTPFIKRVFKGFDKTYTGIAILRCNGDTIPILDNIKVIKK